jgi:hypothetical protein
MSKKHLFENFNTSAYDNTTDPYASILEGPKFTFGNTNKDVTNGDEEEGKLGREGGEDPVDVVDTDTLNIKNPDASELDKEADDILSKAGYNPYGIGPEDALSRTVDIGDFDITTDFDDPEYGISGQEVIKSEPLPDELEAEEQFGLDNPEGVLGDKEPGSGDGYNPPSTKAPTDDPDDLRIPLENFTRMLSTKLMTVDELLDGSYKDGSGLPRSMVKSASPNSSIASKGVHNAFLVSAIDTARAIQQLQSSAAANNETVKPEILASLQKIQMDMQNMAAKQLKHRTTVPTGPEEWDL